MLFEIVHALPAPGQGGEEEGREGEGGGDLRGIHQRGGFVQSAKRGKEKNGII